MGRRTKYREWWSPTIRAAMQRYPNDLAREHTLQSETLLYAIQEALFEAERDPTGRMHEAATIARLFYFRKTHTFRDACSEAGVSFGTGKRRIAKLVYMVGEKAGYTQKCELYEAVKKQEHEFRKY